VLGILFDVEDKELVVVLLLRQAPNKEDDRNPVLSLPNRKKSED
jgi:hypothetical protein